MSKRNPHAKNVLQSKKRESNSRADKTGPAGLRDWQAKKSLLKAYHRVIYDKDLVRLYADTICTTDNEVLAVVEGFYDAFRKWKDGVTPTGDDSIGFWLWVQAHHALNTTASRAMTSPLEDFLASFSQDERLAAAIQEVDDLDGLIESDAKASLMREFGSANGEGVAVNDYFLLANTRTNFESPLTGIQTGRIPVHQFYCLPETAKAWAGLVDSKTYRMYMDCLVSLKRLVASDEWKDAVNNGRYDVVVALGGGGSPEKDRVLAKSLLGVMTKEAAPLRYCINDISKDMIHESVKRLESGKDEVARGVHFTYLLRNFLLLDEEFDRPKGWNSVVWTILGGTLGNVSERDFFRSTNKPAKRGDLLVIGVDTIGDDTPEAFEERMTKQYRNRELDALLLTPVQTPNVRQEAERPLVDVSVVTDAAANRHSNVPGSWTAVFSTPKQLNGNRTVLATSTRYLLEELIAYASERGWQHLGTATPSPRSTYRHLLFRRIL